MPSASSNKTGRKNMETLKGPIRWILKLDYSNQGGWGVSVFLKGCNFYHTELSTHFLSFNEEYAVVKEGKDANRLSQESKRARVNLQLNLCPSKSTTPVLKQILFQYLNVLQLYNWNSITVSIFWKFSQKDEC